MKQIALMTWNNFLKSVVNWFYVIKFQKVITSTAKFNFPNKVKIYPRSILIPSAGPEVVVVVVVTVAIILKIYLQEKKKNNRYSGCLKLTFHDTYLY